MDKPAGTLTLRWGGPDGPTRSRLDLSELARRVATLDGKPDDDGVASCSAISFVESVRTLDGEPDDPRATDDPDADLTHFITVLGRATDSGTGPDVHALPCVSAASADAIVESCRLLARLTGAVPEIVTGPLRLDSQYWVGTENPSGRPKGELAPSESHFIGVSDAAVIKASTKPFHLGLFTTTGALGRKGMWRMYLDRCPSSTLFPQPWHTWIVDPNPDAVVREIASASQWVEFVLSHPQRERGLLFPDWRSVARRYDAVHMTLRAIAAIQGLYFTTAEGIVAASCWDLESTLWLRWCFDSVRLVDVVR